ncbi:uncharacterized protein PHLOEM PROTEIN 2-LIKE A4-like isoform X1 [Rhodamnia argentea]|uniref:Uncharacterized protein PHLOEM PROTEIN 2-LIKE A4-like isoform X1 n=1 Tax=Rhodamnia argentea TaxID=178133 RepID=A0A8B8PXE9_9MYRT|nr:uncharacterized protein PHLOEM PROTEIN 2-LIKE A4-like isoform X1 [Rhodamnia argentea]
MEPDEENTQVEKTRERRPPLLALTFVRKATNADSSTSVKKLCDRIYGGVLMNDNKLKFWVDEVHDKNCFLLLAKELSIIWIDTAKYWGWKNDEKEKCYGGEVVVPMAELREVSWLQISGKFKTIQLSPKTTYEVAFVVKRIANSRGWYLPVNLNLTLPDKTTQGRMENLEKTPEGEWKHILVGTFVTTPENVGEISFSFSETGGHWKSGLLIKGVALRPKD